MEAYEPAFKIMERDGKKSLWVTMPSGEAWNISDLPELHCTEDVQRAIIHAFELGAIAYIKQIEQLTFNAKFNIGVSTKFLEVKK